MPETEPMPPTSPALSSVLDDGDIDEHAITDKVIDMATCTHPSVFMQSSFWDGMTKRARQEQNLEVDYSAPISPKATQDGTSQMLGR